jgi:thiosulfate/3-mercaptopyruvate sulfurtransferase
VKSLAMARKDAKTVGSSMYVWKRKSLRVQQGNRFGRACALAAGAGMWLALLVLPGIAAAQSATLLPAAHLISPEEFLRIVKSSQPQPLILSVGPEELYRQAHIPHAEYAGPASREEGRAVLRQRVQALPRNTFIVLYCGCCPWTHCPNVNPAYTELARMGFTNVKVLKINNDLGTDWVYKGYPTVRGSR